MLGAGAGDVRAGGLRRGTCSSTRPPGAPGRGVQFRALRHGSGVSQPVGAASRRAAAVGCGRRDPGVRVAGAAACRSGGIGGRHRRPTLFRRAGKGLRALCVACRGSRELEPLSAGEARAAEGSHAEPGGSRCGRDARLRGAGGGAGRLVLRCRQHRFLSADRFAQTRLRRLGRGGDTAARCSGSRAGHRVERRDARAAGQMDLAADRAPRFVPCAGQPVRRGGGRRGAGHAAARPRVERGGGHGRGGGEGADADRRRCPRARQTRYRSSRRRRRSAADRRAARARGRGQVVRGVPVGRRRLGGPRQGNHAGARKTRHSRRRVGLAQILLVASHPRRRSARSGPGGARILASMGPFACAAGRLLAGRRHPAVHDQPAARGYARAGEVHDAARHQ